MSSKPSDQRPATDTPWHSAYPQPKNQSPATVTRQKVLRMLQAAEEPRKDLVLVDLRRTDYEVSQPSINCRRVIWFLKSSRTKVHREEASAVPSTYQRRVYTLPSRLYIPFSKQPGWRRWYGTVVCSQHLYSSLHPKHP